jgi:aspartyl-tRNA(Asn)/glutamyl-tRNA(Gln) amidotransferase subunit A
LDTIGLITKTVNDCQFVFQLLNSNDERDSTSIPNEKRNREDQKHMNKKEIRIGIPETMFDIGLNDSVRTVWESVANLVKREMKVKLIPIRLNSLEHSLSSYYVIACAEAYSNLARYDGVRYGHRTTETNSDQISLEEFYSKTRSEGFGKEVKRRLLLGSFVLSKK